MKKLFYLSFSLIYIYVLLLSNVVKEYNRKINILFVFPIIGNRGPATLAKVYKDSINIFSKNKVMSNFFNLAIKNFVSFKFCKEYLNNSNSIIWFQYPAFFNELVGNNFSSIFKNIIYGPTVSPKRWFLFPMKNTFEENWSIYINRIFAYVVQSDRIKKHLISHSKKIKNIEHQYIVSHGCILSNNTYPVQSWKERKIDILLYAKFADMNKENELQHLFKSLDSKYNIVLIRYGNHSKQSLLDYASNSKILIYYSFFDCWPSSLMEMQNIGIYPIVQQCEFIGVYGTCIIDFDLNETKIINEIKSIFSRIYNTYDISNSYRIRNNCLVVLKNTLFGIYKRKNNSNL